MSTGQTAGSKMLGRRTGVAAIVVALVASLMVVAPVDVREASADPSPGAYYRMVEGYDEVQPVSWWRFSNDPYSNCTFNTCVVEDEMGYVDATTPEQKENVPLEWEPVGVADPTDGMIAGIGNREISAVDTSTGAGTLYPTSEITVEGWLDPEGYVARTDGAGYGLSLESIKGDNFLVFELTLDGVSTGVEVFPGPSSAARYVVGTYDGETMRVFLDGQEEGSQPASGSITYGGTTPTLLITQGVGFADGGDEIAIYDEALPAEEIGRRWWGQFVDETLNRIYGSDAFAPQVSDPVNVVSGSFSSTIPSPLPMPAGTFLPFDLTYNGRDPSRSPSFGPGLGAGWVTSLDEELTPVDGTDPGEDDVIYRWGDGSVEVFDFVSSGVWVSPQGVYGSLAYDDVVDEFTLTYDGGASMTFDGSSGLVSAMADGQGQSVTIDRDPADGSVLSVDNMVAGRQLLFSRPGDQVVVEARVWDDGAGDWRSEVPARLVTFDFDPVTGDLVVVDRPGVGPERFVYEVDGVAVGQIGRIERIVGPGVWAPVVTNTAIDAEGRITAQLMPGGATTTFVYDDAAMSTTVTFTEPGSSETLVYWWNAAGEVTQVDDSTPTPQVSNRSWQEGRLSTFVDRRGAAFVNVYDDPGRLKLRIWPDPGTKELPAGVVGLDPLADIWQTYLAALDPAVDAWEQYTYKDEATTSDPRVEQYRNREGETTGYTYQGTELIPDKVTDSAGEISIVASAGGQVTSQSDADGVSTNMYYGSPCPDRLLCSTVSAESTPDESTTTYTYNDAGLVATVTEAAGTTPGGGSPGATTTTYSYDAAGRPIKVVNDLTDEANGIYPVESGYDILGRLEWTSAENNPYTGPFGGGNPSVAYSYTADDQILTETTTIDLASGLSTTTRYGYDDFGNQTAVTVADGTPDAATTSFEYGPLGRLERTTVAPGLDEQQVTDFVYDTDGNQVQRVQDPDGENLVWATGYDFWGRVICEADPDDTKTFLGDGSLECGEPGSTYVSSTEYDFEGRQVKVVLAPGEDADGDGDSSEERVTEYAYDAAGRLQFTSAESGVDGIADPTSVWFNRFGVVEERTYTAAGRALSTVSLPPGVYDFDWTAGTGKVTTTNAYDDAGRVDSTTADVGGIDATTVFDYDERGWLLSQTSPEGRDTSSAYDAAGRVITSTGPFEDAGTVSVARTYTPTGQVAWETDPAVDPYASGTPARSYTYSGNGQLAAVVDALGTTTTYGYDLRGNRTGRCSTRVSGGTPDCVVAPTDNDVAESWAFDDANQLISETRPRDDTATTTVTYGYDALGRATEMIEPVAANESRCVANDYTGQELAQVAYRVFDPAAGSCSAPLSERLVDFGYDQFGQRDKVTDTRGGVTAATDFEYNQAGQMWRRVDAHSGDTVSWAYSAAGNRTELRHAGSYVFFRFTYDNLARLDSTLLNVTGAWVPLVVQEYDDDGLVTREVLADSTTKSRSYEYYASGQLKAYAQNVEGFWPSDPGDRINTDVTWNPDGRVAETCTDTGATGSCEVTDYIYDDAGQLRGVGDGCVFTGDPDPDPDPAVCEYRYGYDGQGNQMTKTTKAGDFVYEMNRAGQVVTEETGGVTSAYAYNFVGDLDTITPTAGNPEAYEYDAAGNMVTWTIDTGTVEYINRFGYDGDNNMVRVAAGSDDGTGEVVANTHDLVWDPTQSVPQIIESIDDDDGPGPNPATATWQNYGIKRVSSAGKWYGYDWLGNGIRSSDFPTLPTSYEPFGAAEDTGTYVWFGYRGELQVGNAFIHLRNRNYDPNTSTFLTQDALDGVNGTTTVANPYQYTDNDPLNKIDPTGLTPDDSDMGAKRSYETFQIKRRQGYGRVRVNLFIAAKTAGLLGVNAYGNDRGFDSSAGIEDSKATISLDFESGIGQVAVNYTCWQSGPSGGKCFDAQRLTVNPVTTIPADACGPLGAPPTVQQCANAQSDAQLSPNVLWVAEAGDLVLMRYRAMIAGATLGMAPSINGEIGLLAIPGTDRIAWCVDRDPFPSLEIYQDVNGMTRTLVRDSESGWPGPIALSGKVGSHDECGL